MSAVALIAILGIGGMVMVISIIMAVMFLKMSAADERDPYHSQH